VVTRAVFQAEAGVAALDERCDDPVALGPGSELPRGLVARVERVVVDRVREAVPGKRLERAVGLARVTIDDIRVTD
jgi:hypothetical protein